MDTNNIDGIFDVSVEQAKCVVEGIISKLDSEIGQELKMQGKEGFSEEYFYELMEERNSIKLLYDISMKMIPTNN
jgi:hypothetical protein